MNDGKVIRFAGTRREMRFPAVSEVRAYWEALRNGRMVPLRSEVDPRGIERALEHAFILERVAPELARFRLAGMHLTDLAGMEVRGMPFSALFTPGARAEIGSILEQTFRTLLIAELSLMAEEAPGKTPLEARLLLLPLQSDLGDISRVLGCLVAEGEIGRAPRRFAIASAALTPITEGRATHSALSAQAVTAAPEFAEPAPAYAAPPVGRGHLRLVKTDR